MIISFDMIFLYCMKFSRIPTCLLYSYYSPFIPLYSYILGVVAIGPEYTQISEHTIRKYTKKQMLVYIWTVNNSKITNQLISLGASVSSDNHL
jgi:hypothetical protein